MDGTRTQFDEFLAQEILDCKGLYFPVKAGILSRLLVHDAACLELHPNPEDEFCMPKIGPNYKIISEYQRTYLQALKMGQPYYIGEPLIVEKTLPSGYRIVNGHHRWAAAMRIGQSRIPIKIVNLMHGEDVKTVLEQSNHTKRVTLDLDEVVFRSGDSVPLEKELPFPWNRIYRQRVRLGVPALFNSLSRNGFDIWLYSAQYHSTDTIQNYFKRYHVPVTGVISAVGKRAHAADESGKSLEKMITNKYQYTFHVDNDSVLQFCTGTRSLHERSLSGTPESWSKEVMDAIDELEKQAEGSADRP